MFETCEIVRKTMKVSLDVISNTVDKLWEISIGALKDINESMNKESSKQAK